MLDLQLWKCFIFGVIILINLPLISAFFRLEKELSTFLTWLERCEAIASSPEMDISADRVKVESELQSIQASSSFNFLLLWLWGFPTPLILNDFLVYCKLTFHINLPKSCSSETVTSSCPEDREQSSVHIEEKKFLPFYKYSVRCSKRWSHNSFSEKWHKYLVI